MKTKNFPYKSAREYQRNLINEAYLSLGIPLIFFLWIFLEFLDDEIKPAFSTQFNYVLISLFVILTVIFIWLAVKAFKKGLAIAKKQDDFPDKLILYKKISRQKFALLFFASAFSVMGFYLTASEILAGLYFVIIFIFSMGSPTKDQIARDLALRDENKKIIIRGEEFSSAAGGSD